MNKSIMNQQNIIYDISKALNEVAQSIDHAIESIDCGDIEAGLDMLKAISREVGSEK